ncbi:MAG: LLM class flavin-dependent oxidoreductase [Aggregatilineales bacterium]
MKFGVHLPTFWADYSASDVRTAIVETAQAAESLGYAGVWANDTVVVSPDHTSFGHVIEPLITLASLVHLIPHLKLGISVLVLPQRNIFLVAKQVATLDVLSEGRLILGIGAGWREDEFTFLKADFAHRHAMTDEAIAVLRVLWRDPVASFHGQFYEFSDAVLFPKPAQGDLPLWMGGNGLSGIRRAAQFGDAWVPFGINLDDFQVGVASLRERTKGRACPTIAAEMFVRVDEPGKPGEPASAHIEGTPDAIARTLDKYQQAGLEYLICGFKADEVDDYLRQMRVFAEQIAPQFVGSV